MENNLQTKEIHCIGSGVGHPKVYFKISAGKNAQCPYCGRIYDYNEV